MAAGSANENTHSIKKQLARMPRAASSSPSPRLMLSSGAPPTPTRNATEPTIVTTGPHTPAPASASAPSPGIWPMKMRSTML